MRAKRFTDKQITDFLSQAKEGASNKFLCEKYNFSASTLRRWKEGHDESIRHELREMESSAAKVFGCLIVASLLLAVIYSRPAGAVCLLLMLGCCIFYIIQFRQKSSEFIIGQNVFLSRSGRGANNVFYKLSWMLVLFVCAFVVIGIYKLSVQVLLR
ncbi:transposase [Klebsiella aerogenes]|uniref:Transposase n=1 Tax=Klebsiella aerogenes TaxID=548 RepID=A0AAP9U966_KLEAE|nr:transposase [Klebsiella aerogenes]QMR43027.1 transposase [Klebsiella aerogenes]